MPGLLLSLVMLSLPCSDAVAADTKTKQERAAQFRMQQMQQKFEQDIAELEQENASLKEQLKNGGAALDGAMKTLDKQKRHINKFEAEMAGKDTQLATCLREAESAKIDAHNELATRQQNLQQSESLNKQLKGEKSRLESALAEHKAEVHACQEKNASLLDMFEETAKKYEKAELKGVEPFTGLKGVKIENDFQDIRDRAEAQLYKPRR